ncbi:MAG: VWA domain-containing protein [Actinomycetia bacterium]|nr:VWA domain-containing protein [Actinomycetes bacterium]
MTRSSLTHIELLLDRSGSMQSIKTDVEGGFDAFMEEQRRQPGECTVSLAQFDDRYEVVYTARPLAEVPPLALSPRGTTAMLDAIGRSVTELGARLAALPENERPGTVIVAIMTDGMENASREWTYDAVKKLITQQEEVYSWVFLYLGADQDAVQVGAQMGIAADQSMTFDRQRSREAYGAVAASVSAYRQASDLPMAERRARAAFTDDQRRTAGS